MPERLGLVFPSLITAGPPLIQDRDMDLISYQLHPWVIITKRPSGATDGLATSLLPPFVNTVYNEYRQSHPEQRLPLVEVTAPAMANGMFHADVGYGDFNLTGYGISKQKATAAAACMLLQICLPGTNIASPDHLRVETLRERVNGGRCAM